MIFLLTRPLRDVTHLFQGLGRCIRFLLTRPLRDVTTNKPTINGVTIISTHTPLAGRDGQTIENVCNSFISTHTPLAGRDSVSLL